MRPDGCHSCPSAQLPIRSVSCTLTTTFVEEPAAAQGTVCAVSCRTYSQEPKASPENPTCSRNMLNDLPAWEGRRVSASALRHIRSSCRVRCHFSCHVPVTCVDYEALLILPQFIWVPEGYSERTRELSFQMALRLQ